MTKDWNEEWEMEQAEVDAIIASHEALKSCDHEWVPLNQTDAALLGFGLDAEECFKCGGVQITVSDKEFLAWKELLEDGRAPAE